MKRGRDVTTGKYVALKIMPRIPDGPRATIAATRLLAEIEAMKLCGDHPHTVALLEYAIPTYYPKNDGRAVVSLRTI